MNRIISMLLMILTVVCMTGCTSFKSIAQRDAEYSAWLAGGGQTNSIVAFAMSKLEDYLASEALSEMDNVVSNFVDGTVDQSDTSADAADYTEFAWLYGGWNGKNCQYESGEPKIKDLTFSSNNLTYSYDGIDLSVWGIKHSDADAICCLFVQRSDGTWVGGKFDWISSSRLSRGLSHITGSTPYNGWTLDGVPNPCVTAFVICNKNGARRSNVLVSTWRR